MKDHIQSCHLTKFDAFGVNRNEVIDLETWLKSMQMSVILREHPKNHILNSYCVISFVATVKSCHSVTKRKKLRWKLHMLAHFLRVSQKSEKKLKVYMVLGDAVSTLHRYWTMFQGLYNFISVYPKSIKLGQMTTLNMIFYVVVSIYRLVKIWNSSQFLAQFWNGQYIHGNTVSPTFDFNATTETNYQVNIKILIVQLQYKVLKICLYL